MMKSEKLLTLAEATKFLPTTCGKRVHPSSLWRWSTRGIKGVRLEVRRLGGRIYTSMEALDRFSTKLNDASLAKLAVGHRFSSPTSPTASRRKKSIERAAAILAQAGI